LPSIINASSSGSGGIVQTADASGVLQLQSNGTTALTVSGANVTFAGTQTLTNNITTTGSINALNTFGFENRIINGAMVIDQRNAGASVNPAAGSFIYSVDRWAVFCSVVSKLTVQQNAGSVTPPAGFKNYLGITSSSAYTIGVGEIYNVVQQIEGYNSADLSWGTASAQTVTLSFWVRSSLTGTFGGALRNSDASRSYAFTYTISSANTWEQKSITVVGDTSGSWNSTNGIGISLSFGLGVGTTFSGTAGAWASANYASATGATSVVGTNGATWYVTGVQLEKGTQATSFDFRSIGTELALCQRYFCKTFDTALGTSPGDAGSLFSQTNTNTSSTFYVRVNFRFPVPMRAAPSVIAQNPTQVWGNGSWRTSSDTGDVVTVVANINTQGCSVTCQDLPAQQWARGALYASIEL